MSEAKTYYQVIRNFHKEQTPEPITVRLSVLEVAIRAFERHKISFPKHRIQLISVEVLRESHVFEGVDEDRDIPLRATAQKATPLADVLPESGGYEGSDDDLRAPDVKRVDKLTTTEAIVKKKRKAR